MSSEKQTEIVISDQAIEGTAAQNAELQKPEELVNISSLQELLERKFKKNKANFRLSEGLKVDPATGQSRFMNTISIQKEWGDNRGQTGTLVPLTDQELRLEELKNELRNTLKRSSLLEQKNLLFPVDYTQPESSYEGSDSEGDSKSHDTAEKNDETDSSQGSCSNENFITDNKIPQITAQYDESLETPADLFESKALEKQQSMEVVLSKNHSKLIRTESNMTSTELSFSPYKAYNEKPQQQQTKKWKQNELAPVQPAYSNEYSSAISRNDLASQQKNSQSMHSSVSGDIPSTGIQLELPAFSDKDDGVQINQKIARLTQMMSQLASTPQHRRPTIRSGEDVLLNPEIVRSIQRIPAFVRNMVKTLTKPPKQRKPEDLSRLKKFVKDVEFFKNLKVDDKIIDQIVSTAGFAFSPKSSWVFRERDIGDAMYIILHGSCKAILQNKDFLSARRNLREEILKLYELVEYSICQESKLRQTENDDPNFITLLEQIVSVQSKLLKLRKNLKKQADELEKMSRYRVVKEYQSGGIFGELALLSEKPRAAAICATRPSFFAVIYKNDYDNYVKRFNKKENDIKVEFCKQVPFLQSLSAKRISELLYDFREEKMERVGQALFKEGDPVTHIAIVKSGEFEIYKKSIKGFDERILSFLRQSEIRKRIANHVMLLPGRSTIFQKTARLIPPIKRQAEDNILFGRREADLEELAFNSVSEELYGIAREQLEQQTPQLNISLKQMRKSVVDKYRDIRVSIQGPGYVFGDFDCYMNSTTYGYSLKAAQAGAKCLLMEKKKFAELCKNFATIGSTVTKTVIEKDKNNLKQLTRVVFSRWYADMVQDNLKIVPDLDPHQQNTKKDLDSSIELPPGFKMYNDTPESPEEKQRTKNTTPLNFNPKSVSVNFQGQAAKDIIKTKGNRRGELLITEYENKKLRQKHASQLSFISQQQAQKKSEVSLPREKLQNQLNTITPMEIVRTQQFFSRDSHILRDKLEEYVGGFPATKVHRQIIARAYNIEPAELGEDKSMWTSKYSKSNMYNMKNSPSRKKIAPNKKNQDDVMDELIEKLLPSDPDLQVDSARMKKALRNALIRNNNQTEKIDVQSILREQVRISRQITDYKQGIRKQSKDSTEDESYKKAYVSSRIIKKIAEDRIHKSLKNIISDAEQGKIDLKNYGSNKNYSTIEKNMTKQPSKFSKLLQSKYNESFKSVLDRPSEPQKKQYNRSFQPSPKGSIQRQITGNSELILDTAQSKDGDANSFNKISHRRIDENHLNQYDILQEVDLDHRKQSHPPYFNIKRQFGDNQLEDTEVYKTESFITQSKFHVQQKFLNRKGSEYEQNRSDFNLSKFNRASEERLQMPMIRLTGRNQSSHQIPIQHETPQFVEMGVNRNFNSNNRSSDIIRTMSKNKMQTQNANIRLQLAALFQPRNVHKQSNSSMRTQSDFKIQNFYANNQKAAACYEVTRSTQPDGHMLSLPSTQSLISHQIQHQKAPMITIQRSYSRIE